MTSRPFFVVLITFQKEAITFIDEESVTFRDSRLIDIDRLRKKRPEAALRFLNVTSVC